MVNQALVPFISLRRWVRAHLEDILDLLGMKKWNCIGMAETICETVARQDLPLFPAHSYRLETLRHIELVKDGPEHIACVDFALSQPVLVQYLSDFGLRPQLIHYDCLALRIDRCVVLHDRWKKNTGRLAVTNTQWSKVMADTM
ncbi:hypothetical protein CLIM01_05772 [Colletotrichum limetticola]|uniref:Uncharacterized protein n=1 Tax=Colletotrichum limetticola TaxID=1209924 RepID=A0ABQ9PZF8_9PEZI|nr:hypothetical protein CLIM01_05772 [Colletotrichum limetticola]